MLLVYKFSCSFGIHSRVNYCIAVAKASIEFVLGISCQAIFENIPNPSIIIDKSNYRLQTLWWLNSGLSLTPTTTKIFLIFSISTRRLLSCICSRCWPGCGNYFYKFLVLLNFQEFLLAEVAAGTVRRCSPQEMFLKMS